jgi:integrase/recombinase XerD
MFEGIFTRSEQIALHQQAPLLTEREDYLQYLHRQEYGYSSLHRVASLLVPIVQFLALNELRVIGMAELRQAAAAWSATQQREGDDIASQSRRAESFLVVARPWLRFHGKLAPRVMPYQDEIAAFAEAMRVTRGLAQATIVGYCNRAQQFLTWLAAEGGELPTVSLREIEVFLNSRRNAGWKPQVMASQCQAMRSFFQYAETQGWCRPNLPLGIRSPRIPKYRQHPKGPSWRHVTQLLKLADGPKPEQLRAKAMLLLLMIYGLRSSEIRDLRLNDFDWRNEVFTVRRAKRGGMQQYPLQYEVGEAILAYLRFGRARSSSRHLFLSLARPHGPLSSSVVWQTVGKRLRPIGLDLEHAGPHSLRHACATRLLQKGASLNEIADYLGHHDTNSIGIYAKHDGYGLRQVAAFGLTGLR